MKNMKKKMSFGLFLGLVALECSEDAMWYGFDEGKAMWYFEKGFSVEDCAKDFEDAV